MNRAARLTLVCTWWLASSIAAAFVLVASGPGGDLPPGAMVVLWAVMLGLMQLPTAVLFLAVRGRCRAAVLWFAGWLGFCVAVVAAPVSAVFVYFGACVLLGVYGDTRRAQGGAGRADAANRAAGRLRSSAAATDQRPDRAAIER